MQPNIDKKFDKTETVLFECQCHGSHYLEVIRDKNSPDLSIYFNDRPKGLWSIIKSLWRFKEICFSDVILSDKDIRRLNKVLTNYLESKKK